MTTDTTDLQETIETNDATSNPDENTVSEPKAKRAYKQRAPKVKAETLDASEAPARKPRRSKANIEKAAAQLEGIHKMVAMIPNLGFMAIVPEEARVLAEGMAGVAEEYDIQISGKAGATIQLLAAAAMVYGPRAAYAFKLKKEKKMQTDGLMTTEMPVQTAESGSASVTDIETAKGKSK